MRGIGIFKAMALVLSYQKKDESDRESIRKKRLRNIVNYARENSPYYKELYKDVKENFTLDDLPTTNKLDLMKNFNDWLTDKSIKLDDINEFMKDIDNVGRKFKGKYLIFTTSGSTGNPLVAVCDKTTNSVMGGINAIRSFARKEDLKFFIKNGKRTMGVFATGGFYLGNSSVRSRLISMPWKKKQIGVTSALLPIDKIVKELNDFKPVMLGGYPSVLELLIEEKKSGRLNITPSIIMTGGEYLSETLRDKLSKAFNCYVQTSYSCTEGGTIGCECTEHHFHINDDFLIVEAVDKNNKPVPNGVQSDKILLTNLFNYTQPFIRYEITDRVVIGSEPCPCGNKSPWLTIEGRTDDILTFKEEEKEIKISPLAIYATLKEVKELKRFQVIGYKDNKVELRIIPNEGYKKLEAFELAKKALKDFLISNRIINVEILLSQEEPKQHSKSGKFKHVINEN